MKNSITINGVEYVLTPHAESEDDSCKDCDLRSKCEELCGWLCGALFGFDKCGIENKNFKKSAL